MLLDLSSLEKAIQSLRRAADFAIKTLAASQDQVQKEVLQAGVIQNFEFTYELCWKFIKRWLEINVSRIAVDGVTRRELFRVAAENRLITEVENWMRFHEARNLTSHTYDPAISEEVFGFALAFVVEAEKLLVVLTARND